MNNATIIPSWSAILGLLCTTAISVASANSTTAPRAAKTNVSQASDPQKLQYEPSAKKAQAKAKAGKKIVFLLFTNERTCPPCKMLEAQILSKPEFAKELQEIAVPVKFALQGRITGEASQLMLKYAVGGTPSIIYTDASGKKIGQSGYRGGDIQSYINEAKKYHEQVYGAQ